MSARLYAIQHDAGGTLWCGPAAIAAVTGHPTSTVVKHAKIITGRRVIRGMYPGEVMSTLRSLDVPIEAGNSTLRQTFAQWRKKRSQEMRRRPVIVLLTGHYVVVAGNRLVDSRHNDPILASDYPRQRAYVRFVIVPGSNA